MGLLKAKDECRLTVLQNPSMYLAGALSAWRRVCHTTGQISSVLSVSNQCFDDGIVIAASLAARRDQHAMFAEFGLMVDGAILTAAVNMVNKSRRGIALRESHSQGIERQIFLQSVTDGPSDDPP